MKAARRFVEPRSAAVRSRATVMKMYLLSLGAGLLVGLIYSLLQVRSPAPPVIALVGLLGILVGEQLLPLARSMWTSDPAASSWLEQVKPHMFGHLPTANGRQAAQDTREEHSG
jgi:XapX domain-containing protein